MTATGVPTADAATRASARAPLAGLIVALALIAVAVVVPAATGWVVYGNGFPPIHGQWDPRLGPGTPFAIALAVLAVVFAPSVVSWPWWRLQVTAFVASIAWMLALATVDGWRGVGAVLDDGYEYLPTARRVGDVGALLRGFVSRIPFSAAPDNWPVHVAGHPPGALLFFVLLVRLGLGNALAAGLVIVILAATIPLAATLTLRRLGAESLARRATPYLVIGPAAIWMAVSADAMFAAVAAWGLCILALAATTSQALPATAWALLSGLVLGSCVMLSYGLPILGVLAIAVLLVARSLRPLPWAILGALACVGVFALAGFRWWEAFPVLTQRYWAGAASSRPGAYWMWGDLAALAVSAGPLVGASIAAAGVALFGGGDRAARRRGDADARMRGAVAMLTIAACACILAADLSQMSRGEVERIWLPFVPWLLVGTALLPARWMRWAIAGQAVFALVVQHLIATGW